MANFMSSSSKGSSGSRFDHCLVEYIWMPSGDNPNFKPGFTVFWGDGRSQDYKGGNAELAAFFSKIGNTGWRITTSVTTSNWILFTLERKIVEE
jgi:hypothetical protein